MEKSLDPSKVLTLKNFDLDDEDVFSFSTSNQYKTNLKSLKKSVWEMSGVEFQAQNKFGSSIRSIKKNSTRSIKKESTRSIKKSSIRSIQSGTSSTNYDINVQKYDSSNSKFSKKSIHDSLRAIKKNSKVIIQDETPLKFVFSKKIVNTPVPAEDTSSVEEIVIVKKIATVEK